jgi:hypothetical protein
LLLLCCFPQPGDVTVEDLHLPYVRHRVRAGVRIQELRLRQERPESISATAGIASRRLHNAQTYCILLIFIELSFLY